MNIQLLHGDCVKRMVGLPEGSIQTVCCDPPYGLSFMGKDWDNLTAVDRSRRGSMPDWKRPEWETSKAPKFQTPAPAFDLTPDSNRRMQEWHRGWLKEVYRVLEPGGVAKVFGGTRTFHRVAAAMVEVGFVDVQLEAWGYGSGFPKSLNVGKAIDRRGGDQAREAFYAHLKEKREAAGLSRTEVSERVVGTRTGSCWNWEHFSLPDPQFWPTLRDLLDLDPAFEPLILGVDREVLVERTLVQGGGTSLQLREGKRREVKANITAAATAAARAWDGWGTALKPSWEPVLVGRKP
jgi:hypothetical protein